MKKAKVIISVLTVVAALIGVAYYNNNQLALTSGEYRRNVQYQNAQIDSLKAMVRAANTKLDSMQLDMQRLSAKTDSINNKADMILYYQKQEAEKTTDSRTTLKLW